MMIFHSNVSLLEPSWLWRNRGPWVGLESLEAWKTRSIETSWYNLPVLTMESWEELIIGLDDGKNYRIGICVIFGWCRSGPTHNQSPESCGSCGVCSFAPSVNMLGILLRHHSRLKSLGGQWSTFCGTIIEPVFKTFFGWWLYGVMLPFQYWGFQMNHDVRTPFWTATNKKNN